MNALEFIDISLKRGNNVILDNVSFTVERGRVYGLIGNNGAGKTSLIKILLGLTVDHKGKLRILSSEDLGGKRKHIGEVLDSVTVDKTLTAAGYLNRIAYMLNSGVYRNQKKLSELLERVGLSDVGNKKIGRFSLGMTRRLMIAAALVGEPEILVLDEPFNGIDPEGMARTRLMLGQLASEGITVLVTSHLIPELVKLADEFGVICKGKFTGSITSGELEKISRNKTVFKTDSPQILAEIIGKTTPEYFCSAERPGEISIFDELQNGEREKLRAAAPSGMIREISTEPMSGEEFLFWKMNGV